MCPLGRHALGHSGSGRQYRNLSGQGEAELLVGLGGVHTLVLEVVGPILLRRSMVIDLLLHVGDYGLAFYCGALHSLLELLAFSGSDAFIPTAGNGNARTDGYRHTLR
jgi:hypothetical protein